MKKGVLDIRACNVSQPSRSNFSAAPPRRRRTSMKMRTASLVVSMSVLAASAWAQTPATTTADERPTVNQRLENQRDRIQAGKQDDQLTKGEATRLRADDA